MFCEFCSVVRQPWAVLFVCLLLPVISDFAGEVQSSSRNSFAVKDDVEWLQFLRNPVAESPLRRLAAPTYGVHNLTFEDNSTYPGHIQGLVNWTNPDPEGIPYTTVAAVILLNRPEEMIGRTNFPVPGNQKNGPLMAADLLRKTWYVHMSPPNSSEVHNDMHMTTITGEPIIRRGSAAVQPQHRRRYTWGSKKYLDRFLCVVCISMPDNFSTGPMTFIPIRDRTDGLPILAANNFSFSDTNAAAGYISGTFSFSVPNDADFTLSSHYRIDLADSANASSTNETVVIDIPIGIELNYTFNFTNYSRGTRDYLRLFNLNENGVSLAKHYVILQDVMPDPPPEERRLSGVSFEDMDMRLDFISGTLQWDPPEDEATVREYEIFFHSHSVASDIDSLASIGVVPVGTNSFTIPANTARNGADHISIFAKNENGRGRVPFVTHLHDRSGQAPTLQVSNLSFADVDINHHRISGQVSWSEPCCDTSSYQQYNIYLSDTAHGDHGVALVGFANVGSTQFTMPDNTELGTKNWILVRAANQDGQGPITSFQLQDLTSADL